MTINPCSPAQWIRGELRATAIGGFFNVLIRRMYEGLQPARFAGAPERST